MPIGPNGEVRPGIFRPVANAVCVMRILTGEAEDMCVKHKRSRPRLRDSEQQVEQKEPASRWASLRWREPT